MKFGKTLASLVVAGSCILGSGKSANSETLFREDFDGYSDNSQLDSQWVLRGDVSNRGHYTNVTDERTYGSSGKSLFIKGNTRNWLDFGANFKPSEKVVLDLNINPSNSSPFISLRGNNGVDISLYFDAFTFKTYDYNHNKVDVMNFVPDNWYHIQRTLDTKTNEGSLFIEDLSDPSKNVLIDLPGDIPNDYINEIGMHIPSYSIAIHGCYIDNISVKVPEPSTLGLTLMGAGLGFGALALKKRRGISK